MFSCHCLFACVYIGGFDSLCAYVYVFVQWRFFSSFFSICGIVDCVILNENENKRTNVNEPNPKRNKCSTNSDSKWLCFCFFSSVFTWLLLMFFIYISFCCCLMQQMEFIRVAITRLRSPLFLCSPHASYRLSISSCFYVYLAFTMFEYLECPSTTWIYLFLSLLIFTT